jgi:hypothetical protein
MSLPNYTKIYLVLATVIAVNLYFNFLPTVLLTILGVILLTATSLALGSELDTESWLTKISFGLIKVLTTSAIVGSIFFYVFALGKIAVVAILLALFWQSRNYDWPEINWGNLKGRLLLGRTAVRPYNAVPSVCFLILTTVLLIATFHASTSGLIISMWTRLPSYFLPMFLLLVIVTIFSLSRDKSAWKLSVLFVLFFSLAGIIYKLGYGFDGFIHEATQKIILDTGTISPKPTQYIGLYSINIFLHFLTGASIAWLGKFLLPILTFTIAPIVWHGLKKKYNELNPISLLAILILPLGFIVTTPQGIANLFLLLFIFLSLAGKASWLIALAILFIHPIAGIVAFVYWLMNKLPFKKTIATSGVIILTCAFIVLNHQLTGHWTINFEIKQAFINLFNLLTWGGLKHNYNFWLDIVYFIKFLIIPTIIILSLATYKQSKKIFDSVGMIMFVSLIAGFIILSTLADFSYLINYENQNYPERLFFISLFFLLPYLIFSLNKIPLAFGEGPRVRPQKTSPLFQERGWGELILKSFFVILLAGTTTVVFYISYPRYDTYEASKERNVTDFDLQAVNLVEQNSNNQNYVVLTDQSVSAGALHELSFKKYYSTDHGQVFFYPIPTGGPLYQSFLDIAYSRKPVTEVVADVENLTQAEKVYIIWPSYWDDQNKIKNQLKQDLVVVGENQNVTVFQVH